jgi:hypothetical protein
VDNSDIVFVGYGVVAPEYGWDDYKGVDVNGKTILMLVNDPPVRVAGDTTLDSAVFKGRAMTYYGRWTYKYEIASLKGQRRRSSFMRQVRPAIRTASFAAATRRNSSTSFLPTQKSVFQ